MTGRADRLSLGKHLLEQREDLGHVQLDVFEIEQMLVVLLFLKEVVDLHDAGSESSQEGEDGQIPSSPSRGSPFPDPCSAAR